MGWLTNVIINDKDIENEQVELMDRGSLYFLGPNLTLRHCKLVLRTSARNLLIRGGVRLFDCTIEVKQELKNHQDWVLASLKGCRFKGRMTGCEFGRWPGYAERWEEVSIEDCDFSEARLDGCRFHSCDPRTLRLPSWPCFTFLDPIRNSHPLTSKQWPGSMYSIIIKRLATQPPSTTAVTWFAPAVAKYCDTTPEALKAVLEQCEGIVY